MSSPEKIDCEKALRHLLEYLDQELEGTLQHQMEQHMSSCRSCFSRLEFEQTLKTHIRKSGTEQAPDSLRNRVVGLLKDFEK
ncbi:MAG: mycothiol system anti-sigma-R factor [Gammaproteobacteria bacterium]|nr:mycothiol system anti-sigma-R factor [Gammaproteobacteria bacterium]